VLSVSWKRPRIQTRAGLWGLACPRATNDREVRGGGTKVPVVAGVALASWEGRAISYANCTAVRAAGAAPIHRGDPGYSSKLDRDGDGIGCE